MEKRELYGICNTCEEFRPVWTILKYDCLWCRNKVSRFDLNRMEIEGKKYEIINTIAFQEINRRKQIYKESDDKTKFIYKFRINGFKQILFYSKNINKIHKYLGCSSLELRKHLENLFQPGMNWKNYGPKRDNWIVDHILPVRCFDLTQPDIKYKINHYTNLQPLWFGDNIRKYHVEKKIYDLT